MKIKVQKFKNKTHKESVWKLGLNKNKWIEYTKKIIIKIPIRSARVKGNQMNFIFFINNGKNCSESIVWSISFYNKLSIRNIMSKDRSRGECLLERELKASQQKELNFYGMSFYVGHVNRITMSK